MGDKLGGVLGDTCPTDNQAAIELLDEWMSTPDDLGDDWWTRFRAELQRFKLR